LCDVIAAKNAERIAEAEAAVRTPPQTSPTPDPESLDDSNGEPPPA
jgi:hypothetical protein